MGLATSNKIEVDFYAEMENAELAWAEVEQTGKTARRCLRCGGEYQFQDAGSGYKIQCKTPACFVVTVRGI